MFLLEVTVTLVLTTLITLYSSLNYRLIGIVLYEASAVSV